EYGGNRCKCQISSNSKHAEQIRETSVITWDKLLMTQKGNIETVDMLLRDLYSCNLPFSEKVFIGIGDFHQATLVISRNGKMVMILKLIKLSLIWNTFEIYDLQKPV
ncbi:3856_t:CDS:1, partial [Diversispora eburnea]